MGLRREIGGVGVFRRVWIMKDVKRLLGKESRESEEG